MDTETRNYESARDGFSDDDDYEPSNDEDFDTHDKEPEFRSGRIDARDYIDPRHPLMPTRKSMILDSSETLRARTRRHHAFWWDVFLTMQDRAQLHSSQESNAALRAELAKWKPRDDGKPHKTRDELLAEIERLKKEVDQGKVVIAYLETERQRQATPRRTERQPDLDSSRGRESEPSTIRPTRRSIRPEPLLDEDEVTAPRNAQRLTSRNTPELGDELHSNPKFPDAPMFSGDRGAFDSWKDKVLDKLTNSAAQYPTEPNRIAYIRSRTDGKAYQQIRARCRPDHPQPFHTADEVLSALSKIYGDRNKGTRAMNELRTLKMKNRSFDSFYEDFARCAADVGCSEDALLPLLENAVSDELARQVIGLQKPRDYYDLVDFYREIDNQMRDYDKRARERPRAPRTPMTNDRPRSSRPAITPNASSEGYVPTAAERTLLLQHGRCFKCGEYGHLIGSCNNPQMKAMPRLPTRPSNKLHQAKVDTDDDDETLVEEKLES
jgi:hypothetical protein